MVYLSQNYGIALRGIFLHLMQTQLLFKLSPEELCNVTVSTDGKSWDGSEGIDQMKRYLKKKNQFIQYHLLSRQHSSPQCIVIIYYQKNASEMKTDCDWFSLIRKRWHKSFQWRNQSLCGCFFLTEMINEMQCETWGTHLQSLAIWEGLDTELGNRG